MNGRSLAFVHFQWEYSICKLLFVQYPAAENVYSSSVCDVAQLFTSHSTQRSLEFHIHSSRLHTCEIFKVGFVSTLMQIYPRHSFFMPFNNSSVEFSLFFSSFGVRFVRGKTKKMRKLTDEITLHLFTRFSYECANSIKLCLLLCFYDFSFFAFLCSSLPSVCIVLDSAIYFSIKKVQILNSKKKLLPENWKEQKNEFQIQTCLILKLINLKETKKSKLLRVKNLNYFWNWTDNKI